jgi:hypothetical protein
MYVGSLLVESATPVNILEILYWEMYGATAAIGGLSCLYWVPLAFRSLAMGTYGLSYGEYEIRPAARWRLARRARWLAGRARASSQSQIYA